MEQAAGSGKRKKYISISLINNIASSQISHCISLVLPVRTHDETPMKLY